MLWDDLAGKWAGYRPPLCPDEQDVAGFRRAISGHEERVLLLGVTPQLARLGHDLTAVDYCQIMIQRVWPGDRSNRRTHCANWLNGLPADRHFTAAVTDGGLSCLTWPEDYRCLFAELRKACIGGFRFAARCHLTETVQAAPSLDALEAEAASGVAIDPHLARHRIAHALVAKRGTANIRVAEMAALAREILHRDPDAIAALAAFSEADESRFSFPSKADILALAASCGLIAIPTEGLPPGFLVWEGP